jgi:thioesterase domain-containing protein
MRRKSKQLLLAFLDTADFRYQMNAAVDYINSYINYHIPLTRHMELTVTGYDTNGILMKAPLPPNINDKGTAFGGSLAAMLTLAGWALSVLYLRDSGLDADAVVYKSSMEFRKPVTGDLIIRCEFPSDESKDKFLSDFRTDKKAKWQVEAFAVNSDGEKAVIYTGKYAAFPKEHDQQKI